MLKTGGKLRKGNRNKLYAAAAEDDDDSSTFVGHDDLGPIYAVEHVPDEQALGGPFTTEEWYFHMSRAKCWEYNNGPPREPSPPITRLASEVALREMIRIIGGDTSAIPRILTQLAQFSEQVGAGFCVRVPCLSRSRH